MSELFRVRLESPWAHARYAYDGVELSTEVNLDEADGILCLFAPSANLFRFKGPRAWYCCEPVSLPHGHYSSVTMQVARWRLKTHEFLYHGHPDPRFRVPCVTALDHPVLVDSSPRKQAVVAVATRYGARWRRSRAQHLRNAFYTHPEVDLFGAEDAWRNFRRHRFAARGTPQNFRGGIAGEWGRRPKIELLSQYHASVCLENMDEPWYFTEKFVDAVLAGCVPIYHPHPTVRTTFLDGARWVDPADFGFDVGHTLHAALEAPREEIATANRAWLESPIARSTRDSEVMRRCAEILRNQPRGAHSRPKRD